MGSAGKVENAAEDPREREEGISANGRKNPLAPFYKRAAFRKYIFILSLIIIPMLNFIVFWVYVSADTILSTFRHFSMRTGEFEWYGLQNYIEVFREYMFGLDDYPEKRALFWNSFHAVPINLIILPLSFVCAYAFYKKIRFQKYFRVCFYLPSIISISVLALCFRYMFHSDFGPIKALFENWFGYAPVWLSNDSDQMWTLIYIFCIWAGMSTNVIMMNSAMSRIPEDISDYSRLEGVGFWREAVQIVLPLVLPTVGIYMISVVTAVAAFALPPMLMAGTMGLENKFGTSAWFILEAAAGGQQNTMILASTIGICMTILLTPFVVAVRVLVNKFTPEVDF